MILKIVTAFLVLYIIFFHIVSLKIGEQTVHQAESNQSGLKCKIIAYQQFPFIENFYADLVVFDESSNEVLRTTVMSARDSVEDIKVEFDLLTWEGTSLLVHGGDRYAGPNRFEF